MESIFTIIVLVSIVLFLLSLFHSNDPVSIFLDFTIPKSVIIRVRWITSIIALVSTVIFVLYSVYTN